MILDTHHFRHAPGTKVAHHNFHITTKMSKIASKFLPKAPKTPREVSRRPLDSRRRFQDVSSPVVFSCIFFECSLSHLTLMFFYRLRHNMVGLTPQKSPRTLRRPPHTPPSGLRGIQDRLEDATKAFKMCPKCFPAA